MIRKTLRTVCESPLRWLIVTGGTIIVALVLVVPLVDVYSAERDEKEALLAEVTAASQVAAQLHQFESRVAERTAQLAALEARTYDEQRLPQLRDRLVELARQTGCSLRRLNVGEAMSRPWYEGDNPIDPRPDTKRRKTQSNFTLEWRPITISVTGTTSNLRSLLERLDADNMLVHTKVLEMYPSGRGRRSLTLDMELWYFNLIPTP